MNRRDFLRASLLGVTTLAAPRTAAPISVLGGRVRDVLVVGGGMAGLVAAWRLRQAGIPVTVLEARNRPGGRVHTHVLDRTEGLTVELGAEWIGASHTLLIELCSTLGLSLQPHTFRTYQYLGGRFVPPTPTAANSDWERTFGEALAGVRNLSPAEQARLDSQDWWRYLVGLGIPESELELRELADSTDFGETIRQVSALLALWEYSGSSPNNEMDMKVRGGNSRLVEALIRSLGPERVLLNHTVAAVVQDANGVQVTCRNGATFTASHLICALPGAAVLNIQWQPALPARTLEALRELQYCRISKSHLLLDRRPWPEEDFALLTDRLGHLYFHSSQGQPGKRGCLTAYATGDRAYVLSRLSVSEREAALREGLPPELIRNTLILGSAHYYWGEDPFVQGAYALYDTGQWTRLLPTLQQPFLRVRFAGEHLSEEWQGFLEGAAGTGKAAAESLL